MKKNAHERGTILMNDETYLKESLISAFEQLKAQSAAIAIMKCDLSALLTIALEDSLEKRTRHAELFKKEMKDASPEIVVTMKLYDDLILALKTDYFS